MQTRRNSCAAFIAGGLLIFSAGAPGQGISPIAEGKRMTWPTADGPAHQLRLVAPDGTVGVLDFAAGQPVTAEHDWQPGQYRFELIELPVPSAEAHALAKAARERGEESAIAAPKSRNGGFLIDADGVAHAGKTGESHDTDDGTASPRSTRDQVIADDLIVTGGICAGIDCADGENFAFMQLKIDNNNPRLRFEDSSSTAGFATRDWAITANDNISGGLDYLAFSDIDAGTNPFWVQGESRNNALVVTGSRVGFGTSTPTLDLHYVDSDTPALRMEQTSAGGFTPQTWDVAGNEANFFIRNVTGGSLLPFRIRPDAPGDTLTLNAGGNVGIGLVDAAARLDILRINGTEPLIRVRSDIGDGVVAERMLLDASGDLRVNGTISQLSSRAAKTNFSPIDAGAVLDAVADLPITFWNYLHQDADARHLGPTAEDFHAAFGLGERPTEIAPGDLAGVALAAIQALNLEVAERDRRIGDLEARLQRLEARLADTPDSERR